MKGYLKYYKPGLLTLFISLTLFLGSRCSNDKKSGTTTDTIPILIDSSKARTPAPSLPAGEKYINTGTTRPEEIIAYAKTLLGVPYKYGSVDPDIGFDCSGFITHVFNHFDIIVPRPSVDFTDINRPVNLRDAKKGDLILFTGTDSVDREVGHMGIIVTGSDEGLSFIHSSSGKANGVTITPLNEYYQGRFVKVIRIFKQNEDET